MKYSIVGIDLGTSTTVVHIRNCDDDLSTLPYSYVQSGIMALTDINGEDDFPTVIFRKGGGYVAYGHEAENLALRSRGDGGELVRNFKMDLIAPDHHRQEVAKRNVKEFLGFVKTRLDAQKFRLSLEDNLVVAVSVPAKWPKDTRDFMRDEVVAVGLAKPTDKVEIIDEPTAASRATLMSRLPDLTEKGILGIGEFNVMMVDMGAGTSDVAVFKLTIGEKGDMRVDSTVSFPTIDNPGLCGGREIDEALCDYVIGVGGDCARKNRPFIEHAIKKFKEKYLSLALKEGSSVDIRDDMYFEGDAYVGLEPITPESFFGMTKGHWQKWHSIVDGAMFEAKRKIGVGAEDVDLVILTGGHSSWGFVRDYFLGQGILDLPPLPFRKIRQNPERILCEENRTATVANGLAIGERLLPFVRTSVNRYSIRISVGGTESNHEEVLLEENSVLPCQGKEVKFDGILPNGHVASSIPCRIMLLCGSGRRAMREIAYTDVVMDRPLNVNPNAPLKWKIVMLSDIDDEYRIEVNGMAVAMDLDNNGEMIGVPKYTKFKLKIGDGA